MSHSSPPTEPDFERRMKDIERTRIALATLREKAHATPMQANERQIDGSHYQSSIQHWDYVLANKIPYLEAQVIKYLTRWRKKNGTKDVEKAVHFLQKLCESEGIPWPRAPETLPADGSEPCRGYVNQDRAGDQLAGKPPPDTSKFYT